MSLAWLEVQVTRDPAEAIEQGTTPAPVAAVLVTLAVMEPAWELAAKTNNDRKIDRTGNSSTVESKSGFRPVKAFYAAQRTTGTSRAAFCMMGQRMYENQTKARLKSGETVFGCFVRHVDPGLAEVLGYYGWDYLLFDGEHSFTSARDCEHLARACEVTGVTPLARVPTNQSWLIGQYLDAGMQGVQVPMVNSIAEAEAAVRAAKYNPLGSRGLAAARAADYGQEELFRFADYVPEANAQTMVVVQVETEASLGQLHGILKVPEIDVVFVGPSDLSLSLGHPGDFQHPKVREAFDFIASVVAPSNKALGVLVSNAEGAAEWRKRGARYVMITVEALLGAAARGFLRTARGS